MSDQGQSGHQEKVESDGIESPCHFYIAFSQNDPKDNKT